MNAPQSVHDLKAAFCRVACQPAPSSAQCREILRAGGWSAETAGKALDLHPHFLDRLLRGQHLNLSMRRMIAKLPANPAQP